MAGASGHAYEDIWKSLTGMPKRQFTAEERYTFVAMDANGEIDTAATGATTIYGVLDEPNGPGQPARVYANGISFIQLGGTIAAGDGVAVGANGKAVKVAADAAKVGTCIVGGTSGDIGSVLLGNQ